MKLSRVSFLPFAVFVLLAACTAEQDLGGRPPGEADPGSPGTAPGAVPDGGAVDGAVDGAADGAVPGDTKGPCVPGELRCSGDAVQQCNASGTAWAVKEVCGTFCADGACALDGLDVAKDQSLDGVVHVKGAVVVHAGATLVAPSGELTLIADSIEVQQGGSIAAAPVGADPSLQGAAGRVESYKHPFDQLYDYTNVGGGGGAPRGSSTDSEVGPGGPGGVRVGGVKGAPGGGAIRLLAPRIVVAGQVSANGANGESTTTCGGGGGGGAGGGILAAGDDVTVSGAMSAMGGAGGTSSSGCSVSAFGGVRSGTSGLVGLEGRIKILWGRAHAVTGTLLGAVTQGIAPPIPVTSTSHPSPSRIYNDDGPGLHVSWAKAFATSAGAYASLDTAASAPPGPAKGRFSTKEFADFAPADLVEGNNFFHVVSVDAASQVGAVESVFRVRVNTKGPVVTSTSHPESEAWSNDPNAFFSWSFPQGDADVKGALYVLDHFGLTVPSSSATFVPTTQKQLVQSNLAPGVWVLHVVSVDHEGRRTKAAGHYRVSVGPNPGSGGVAGHVVDATSRPLVGASVTLNRGLYTATTNGSGNFSFAGIPAGAWEISVTVGAKTTTKNVTVAKDAIAPADLSL